MGVTDDVDDGTVKELIEGEYVDVVLKDTIGVALVEEVCVGNEEEEGVIVIVLDTLEEGVNDKEDVAEALGVAEDVGVFV